ncbi:MAG: hypothetical protein KJ630_03620 [Proteobacteria bacterium]|nr:hypothetical protein [Pseudomonadota bacterium]
MDNSLITIVFCLIMGFLVIVIAEKTLKYFSLRKVDKIIADIQSGNIDDSSIENSKYGIIEIVENGFQIKNTSDPDSIYFAWIDIAEIVGFKRDLGTTDLICLGFKTGEDTFVEVHEEMFGFKILCESMLNEFKEISDTWYFDVAHPAFETNLKTLWIKNKRANQPLNAESGNSPAAG